MFTFKKFALAGAVVAALSMTSCSDKADDEVDDKDLDWKALSGALSLAGRSYGDLDANKTYDQAGAKTNAGDIDVVAYYNDGAANKVFNPCGIETIGGDECGAPELYPIPQEYQAALKSATKLSEIAEFLGDLDAILGTPNAGVNGGDGNEVWEIDIAKDKSFLVLSTDTKYFIVTITEAGTKTVSLKFSGNGFEK